MNRQIGIVSAVVLSQIILGTSSFALVRAIPKAEIDLMEIKAERNQRLHLGFSLSDRLVLKNSKGTLLQKSGTETTPANWFNLCPELSVQGVCTENTYEKFGIADPANTVIVAVVDSGVDVNHEDLQGKIWMNSNEIPNNGIDDDKNGYIDDVFGWNFLGGSKGSATMVEDSSLSNGLRLVQGDLQSQIGAEQLEVTRELVRMQKVKDQLESIGETLSTEKQAYLDRLTTEVSEGRTEAQKVLDRFQPKLEKMKFGVAILKNAGLAEITIDTLTQFQSTDPVVTAAKSEVLELLTAGYSEARLTRIVKSYGQQVAFYYNTSFAPRAVVGDNPFQMNDKNYGNNDVLGTDPSHGTHVSGIIAANRSNDLGIKGVATNVKIMAVRVVPDGDERDKDVANGIRYAVDNGAKIINMSFGKDLSPQKSGVDEAVKYAESKGVLIVHAAGNSNQNNDTAPNFPNRKLTKDGRSATNWIEVGASSYKKGDTLPAVFSNYGKFSVDLFAPGVDILSSTPGNHYDTYSGTSMASPTAAGVAALVLSYQPNLSLADLRAVLVDTSRRLPRLKVKQPGSGTEVLFSDLSINGSIIDAYQAVSALTSAGLK